MAFSLHPLFLCALVSLVGASCSVLRKAPEKPTQPQSPVYRDQRIGKIELHNPESKFVLIRMDNPTVIVPGSTLLSRSKQGQITALKVSPERKGSLISADVISGYPQNGDAVFITKATQEAIVEASKASSTGVPLYQGTIGMTPGVIPSQAPFAGMQGADGLPLPGSIPSEAELHSPLPQVQVAPLPFPSSLDHTEPSAPSNE